MGTAIKHPVPDRVKPSFVIFDIRALWRSGSWQQLASLLTLLSWRLDLSCRIFEQINWTEKIHWTLISNYELLVVSDSSKRWTCSRMTMKFRSLVGYWPCCADKHLFSMTSAPHSDCCRNKPGVNRAITSSKMRWFEKNLQHVHRSIDTAAKCKGQSIDLVLA